MKRLACVVGGDAQFGIMVEFEIDDCEYSDGECRGDLLEAFKVADEIVEWYENFHKGYKCFNFE